MNGVDVVPGFAVHGLDETELVAWEPDLGEAAEVLEGEMKMTWRVLSVSPDGRNATGLWAAEPHRVRLTHPFHESYVLLSGRLTATPEGGEPRQLGPGDSIVLPRGTVWECEVHEPVRKYWSLFAEEGLEL